MCMFDSVQVIVKRRVTQVKVKRSPPQSPRQKKAVKTAQTFHLQMKRLLSSFFLFYIIVCVDVQ